MGNEQLPSEGPTAVESIAGPGQPNHSSSNAVTKFLREVLDVQAERVKTYSVFEQAFADYRTSGNEQAYVSSCQQVTSRFKDCSQQIIKIEDALKEAEIGRADLAETLRALQSQEKKKLHMTAVLQVLKKAGRPSERSEELREHLRRQQGHQCLSEATLNGDVSQAGGLVDSQEESEYEAALGEATKGIQDAVTEINEKLEDIRYELADLDEPRPTAALEPAGESAQPSLGEEPHIPPQL